MTQKILLTGGRFQLGRNTMEIHKILPPRQCRFPKYQRTQISISFKDYSQAVQAVETTNRRYVSTPPIWMQF